MLDPATPEGRKRLRALVLGLALLTALTWLLARPLWSAYDPWGPWVESKPYSTQLFGAVFVNPQEPGAWKGDPVTDPWGREVVRPAHDPSSMQLLPRGLTDESWLPPGPPGAYSMGPNGEDEGGLGDDVALKRLPGPKRTSYSLFVTAVGALTFALFFAAQLTTLLEIPRRPWFVELVLALLGALVVAGALIPVALHPRTQAFAKASSSLLSLPASARIGLSVAAVSLLGGFLSGYLRLRATRAELASPEDPEREEPPAREAPRP